MFVVVSYDIPDDRRRTRVMKTLKDFGAHVQYSVFECDLDAREYERLRQRLKKLVEEKEDDVRFYTLCADCLPRTKIMGRGKLGLPREYYIV
jgi:CRISPR-associated protein Cas2